MKKISKRLSQIRKKINDQCEYTVDEIIILLKENTIVKFNESVDVAIQLGINPKKSDQNIRSSTILPHGIGRPIRIAVFAQGVNAEIAKKHGADYVGMDDLANKIKNEKIKFDLTIASPDAMHIVGQLGPILGPRGLMPNPKIGTVTNNISKAIKNAKNGQICFKNDKSGIIHTIIGKINFEKYKIKENLYTLLSALKKNKPKQCKGPFFKKITFATTMSPSITVNLADLKKIIN